jgi:preprotein translocase subunit SecG
VSFLVPLLSAPIIAISIILIITSVLLTAAILIHKGRGGGLSDLFGGGMTSSLGGSSVAERNLDRATVIVGLIWVVCVIALLLLYRASFG